MADFETVTYTNSDASDTTEYSSNKHSRHSSISSGLSAGGNKENQCSPLRSYSSVADNSSGTDNSGGTELILMRGRELLEESATESVYVNGHLSNPKAGRLTNELPPSHMTSGGTAKAKAAKSPYSAGKISSIPEEEFTIPPDGNISGFTCDQLAGLLQCLRVDDRIIVHLHKKQVDGKRFARLKDSELESLNINKNPVVMFFRGKSDVKKGKSKGQWRL